MTTDNKNGVFKRQGLTERELVEIKTLADVCEAYENLHMKLNWGILRSRPHDQTNDFLYYENNVLVGFLAFFNFNPSEGEASGMVHPERRRRGIFRQLFAAVCAEARSRSVPTLLLIVEHDSASGQGFAASVKPAYHHSEYRMELAGAKPLPPPNPRLHFRLARPDEAPMLEHINAVSFDMDESSGTWYGAENFQNPKKRFYIAVLDETDEVYVGKLDVSLGAEEAYIAGVGVLPAYQRRGYGRQMIAQTVHDVLALGQQRIVLEVEANNRNALTLYQSCGFKEVSSFDYYSLSL